MHGLHKYRFIIIYLNLNIKNKRYNYEYFRMEGVLRAVMAHVRK